MVVGLISTGDVIRVVLASLGYLFLPGYLWLRLLFRRELLPGAAKVPLAFCLGVSTAIGTGLVLRGLNLAVQATLPAVAGVVALLLVLNLAIRPIKRPEFNWRSLAWPWRRSLVVLLLFLLLVFVVSLWSGPALDISADLWVHLAYVREVADNGQVLPSDPYFPGVQMAPAVGPWHYVLAELMSFSGTSLLSTWGVLTSLVTVLILLAVCAFATELLEDEELGVLSAILFFLTFQQPFVTNWFRYAAYPSMAGWVFLPVMLYLVLRYLREGERRLVLLVAVLGAALLTIHAVTYLLFWLALFSLFVADLLWAPQRRQTVVKYAVLALPLGLLSLPYMVYRFTDHLQAAASSAAVTPGAATVTITPDWPPFLEGLNRLLVWIWQAYDYPSLYLKELTYLGVITILLALLLWRQRQRDWGRYLLGLMWVPPLFYLLPGPAHVLDRVMFGYGYRTALVIPYALVLAYLFDAAARILCRDSSVRTWLRGGLALGLLGVSLLPFLVARVESYMPWTAQEQYRSRSPLAWQQGYAFLERKIAQPATILSDPATSYAVPVLTRHHVAVPMPGHTTPYLDSVLDRVWTGRYLLSSPYLNSQTTWDFLERYSVDYVVVNLPADPLVASPYGPFYSDSTLLFLQSNPTAFEPVYAADGFYLFRYLKPAAGTVFQGKDHALPAATRLDLPMQHRIDRDLTGALMLAGYDINTRQVAPGSTLQVTLYWQAEEPITTSFIGFVALLYQSPEVEPGCLNKLPRKLAELRSRQHYKVNTSFTLDPRTDLAWMGQPGRGAVQTLDLYIPPNTAPGTYQLGVYLAEESRFLASTFLERLVLEDRCRFAGVDLGTIEIVR